MIIFNNNEINTVYYEDKKIKNAYYGNNLIFDFNNYTENYFEDRYHFSKEKATH